VKLKPGGKNWQLISPHLTDLNNFAAPREIEMGSSVQVICEECGKLFTPKPEKWWEEDSLGT
jgi:hypothetical protein